MAQSHYRLVLSLNFAISDRTVITVLVPPLTTTLYLSPFSAYTKCLLGSLNSTTKCSDILLEEGKGRVDVYIFSNGGGDGGQSPV